MKEIQNTKLLVSLNHGLVTANLEIFDTSLVGVNKIYSLGEISGGRK